jgi:hypothetical protein
MPAYRTAVGHEFAHKDISIILGDDTDLNPQWLIEFFEDSIKKGKQFLAEETIQIGWMITTLKENSRGDLEIWEPQFDSIPIKWTKGANNTLRHLILQRAIAGLFGHEPVFPSLRQAGIASSSFMNDSTEFTMNRDAPSGNHSGWRFISNNDNRKAESALKSLFEISFYCMRIVPFLALPPGVVITKRQEVTTVRLGEKTISSANNEILARIAHAEILV